MIAISFRENSPKKNKAIVTLIQRKCKAAQYVIRATVHTTLQYTIGELAVERDMLYPFLSKVDRSKIIFQTNKRENQNRKKYDLKVG